MRVFKIPDGKGGITYIVQTPDGAWHDTDEQGNFLPELPKEKKRERCKQPSKSEGRINLGVAFTPEEYKDFSDYINWRCIFKEKCTKGPFLVKMVKEIIRKDKEYMAFRKNYL